MSEKARRMRFAEPAKPVVDESRRKLLKLAVFSAAASACQRLSGWSSPRGPARCGARNISAERLGFVAGSTTVEDAISMMSGMGILNILKDTNAETGDGRTLTALAADRQECIHIFRAGVYEKSLPVALPHSGMSQILAMRPANFGGGITIMVMAQDMRASADPSIPDNPVLAFIPYGPAHQPVIEDISWLQRMHGGILSPLFVGYDLDFSITFVARDNAGLPWDDGYFVGFDGSRAIFREESFYALYWGCDCIRNWAEGE
ncbi:MAG: hypothetical protein PHQ80_02675 [Candidatus ainarchaeum sp.]|nr:hypothetical protein [Candidatus ainarchaeum sp.]MDD5096663.1 hypothetical protein [Candidatus ainarchaeum sp.]